MNYRSRWQQRRKRESQKRLLVVLGVVVIAVLAFVLISGLRHTHRAWTHDFHTSGTVRMTRSGNVIFCALQSGWAAALSASSGEQVWPEVVKATMGFGARPAVAGNVAVFPNDNGTVTALSAATGESVWQVGTGQPVRSEPLVRDGVVYVGGDDGNVYALDLDDGVEHWRFNGGGAVCSGFALVNGTLIFGASDGKIAGLSAASGLPAAWRHRTIEFPVYGKPVGVGNKVAIGTDSGRVYVLDALSGTVSSHIEVPDTGLVRCAPLVDKAVIYAASTDGLLVACNRLTPGPRGRLPELWQRKVGRELSTDLAMDEHFIYCAGGGSSLLALSKRNGRIRRRWEFPGQVRGSVIVSDGLVIAATTDGKVIAFRAPAP